MRQVIESSNILHYSHSLMLDRLRGNWSSLVKETDKPTGVLHSNFVSCGDLGKGEKHIRISQKSHDQNDQTSASSK